LIIKKKKIEIEREGEREEVIEMSLEEYKLKRREVYGEALLQPRRQNHAMNETS